MPPMMMPGMPGAMPGQMGPQPGAPMGAPPMGAAPMGAAPQQDPRELEREMLIQMLREQAGDDPVGMTTPRPFIPSSPMSGRPTV